MSVAWGQFRPGIANADYGSPIEQMMRQTLVLHPGTIQDTHLIHSPKPILAPKLSLFGGCHKFFFLLCSVANSGTLDISNCYKVMANSDAWTRQNGNPCVRNLVQASVRIHSSISM